MCLKVSLVLNETPIPVLYIVAGNIVSGNFCGYVLVYVKGYSTLQLWNGCAAMFLKIFTGIRSKIVDSYKSL